MKMLMIQYRDSEGLPRAYAVGPIDKRDEIEELAKGMLAIYLESKCHPMKARDFTRHEQTYELTPEGHVMT